MNAQYLRVKNWSKLQHYSKRRPPWIKLYNSIIGDDDKFADLDDLEQWQLVRIWLVASRSTRYTLDENAKIVPVLAYDEQTLRVSTHSRKKLSLDRFVRDGWLIPVAECELVDPENASPVLANDGSNASAELEVREAVASSLLGTEEQRFRGSEESTSAFDLEEVA